VKLLLQYGSGIPTIRFFSLVVLPLVWPPILGKMDWIFAEITFNDHIPAILDHSETTDVRQSVFFFEKIAKSFEDSSMPLSDDLLRAFLREDRSNMVKCYGMVQ